MDFEKVIYGMALMEKVNDQLSDSSLAHGDVHVKIAEGSEHKMVTKIAMSGTRLMQCFLVASTINSMSDEDREKANALTEIMRVGNQAIEKTAMKFDNSAEFKEAMKREGMGE